MENSGFCSVFRMKFDIERWLAQRRARQAEEWFFNEDSSELFSFVSSLVWMQLKLPPLLLQERLRPPVKLVPE